VTYKATIAGVPLVLVDPHNTSRTCPECGHCDKANRRSQAEFVCQSCGFAAHADVVGAVNIARKGRVARPMVWGVDAGNEDFHSSTSLSLRTTSFCSAESPSLAR
jgi:putative transposase